MSPVLAYFLGVATPLALVAGYCLYLYLRLPKEVAK